MSRFAERITREELHQLPLGSFEGEINIVTDDKGMDIALDYLYKCPVVGFDTETRPSFKKGSVNSVAILQLSDEHKAFIFKLKQIGLPDALASFLSDTRIIKVGAAIKDDLIKLRVLRDFEPGGFVELQSLAQVLKIESYSVRKLAGIVLGIRISKSQQVSNWESGELSESQIRYAATDAWVCFQVYKEFLKELE
ncbi:MAG: 3'-5' exonuclease [Bacteroidota bacterium]